MQLPQGSRHSQGTGIGTVAVPVSGLPRRCFPVGREYLSRLSTAALGTT